MKLIDSIVQFRPQMQEIRRDLHAHPELGYEEQRTSELVASKLAAWGVPTIRGLGTTGVVGVLKHGSSQRAIGLRADMDALPMTELNTFTHASRNEGRMHACGHDGHVAMLLGAAHHLARERHFDGTVYLIFQPAEEVGAGARRMIDHGLFEQCPMDVVYGMHNWPGHPVGTFGAGVGPMMASGNQFEVIVRGKGSHGAQPHQSIDPVMVAVQIAQSWQMIVSRNMNPIEAGVLSITQIHAGSATNVIPDSASLLGTVRAFKPDVLDLIERRMQEIASHTCAAFGAQLEFKFTRNYPALVNHSSETALAVEVARSIVGHERVDAQAEPTTGSEDFSFMLQAKPGSYLFIGNGEGDHRDAGHGPGPCNLHNPSYDFNDALLPIGATYWVRLVEAALGKAA